MSDDLKNIVVDWNQTTSQNDNTDISLVTTCTEGADLIGVETAEKKLSRSYETFSKNNGNK
ncbi:MAG: hypothetical protein J6K17_04965 [Oscillospiraceae bacterium]|nr:hypothetical protein [Oscillospiraceae bacterium]